MAKKAPPRPQFPVLREFPLRDRLTRADSTATASYSAATALTSIRNSSLTIRFHRLCSQRLPSLGIGRWSSALDWPCQHDRERCRRQIPAKKRTRPTADQSNVDPFDV